jgi:mono/diheme cytochrome c family protein
MTRSSAIRRIIIFLLTAILIPVAVHSQEERHKHEHHSHPEYAKIKNPVTLTEKSIAQGRELYKKHCLVCHGEQGKGGIGPRLTGSIRIHGNSDGETFHVITDGVAGTAMKSFGNELSEEMRWHLVNYISGLRSKTVNN